MKKIPLIFIVLIILMIAGTILYKKIGSGSITDPRDGKTYKTVKIGDQEWMAENLNYEYNVGSAKSFCYGNNPENCQKYGRLYTWSAAMDSAAMFSSDGEGCGAGKTCESSEAVRGICPEGWVLPTVKDWADLFREVGGQSTAGVKLKSSDGWTKNGNGTDIFSFTAVPSGNEDCTGASNFFSEGSLAFFWSSTEVNNDFAFQMYLSAYYTNSWLESRFGKSCGYSVRCIKKKPGANQRITSASATGSIVDYRDGKTYRTTKIGNQEWMAENLNYDYNVGSAKSYCYDNSPENCETYGRLYTWSAAMDSAATFSTKSKDCGIGNEECWPSPPIQGICPEGWHLPSNAELQILVSEAMKTRAVFKSLFATSGWNRDGFGSDDFSFSLFPAGFRSSQTESFIHQGDCAYLWTTDSYNGWSVKDYSAVYLWFSHDTEPFPGIDKRDALSIRCIKD